MNRDVSTAANSNETISKVWPTVGLLGYAGSMAHGTQDDQTDDIDMMGIFISPLSHYLGLTTIDHAIKVDVMGKYDFCLYEIRKYFKLLLNNNPNVMSLMFLPDNMYLTQKRWGKRIVDSRGLFMSKKLHKSFGGYAWAQIIKMERSCTNQAYQGAKRKERFQKFGYDCKNAAHSIRLLKMGVEALSTGEINVHRSDAQQLREIKMGKWSKESVLTEARRLLILMDEALVRSPLPANPDFHGAEDLLIDILTIELRQKCHTAEDA